MDYNAGGDEDVEMDGDAEAGQGEDDLLGAVHGADGGSLEGVLHRDEPLHREGHRQPHAQGTRHRPKVDLELRRRGRGRERR